MAGARCSRASLGVATTSGASTAIALRVLLRDLVTCSMLARSLGSSLGAAANQRVEDLAQHGLRRRPQAEREHIGVVPLPRAARGLARPRRERHGLPATLLAAIEAPVPVQQQTIPCSARPSATSRAVSSQAHAQSLRSPSRQRAVRDRLVTAPVEAPPPTARARGVSMSLATANFMRRRHYEGGRRKADSRDFRLSAPKPARLGSKDSKRGGNADGRLALLSLTAGVGRATSDEQTARNRRSRRARGPDSGQRHPLLPRVALSRGA